MERRWSLQRKSCASITNVKYPIEGSTAALRVGPRSRTSRPRKEKAMSKLSVVCPECGRPLEPIGDALKLLGRSAKPKNPDKVCCPVCKKVWLPHEITGPTGSLFKKDMGPADPYEGVPW